MVGAIDICTILIIFASSKKDKNSLPCMVSLAAADKNIHGEHRVPVTCALVGLETEGKRHGAK
jgi:hypothetical protein